MVKMLGGKVTSGHGTSEFGKSFVKIKKKNIKILENLFLDNQDEGGLDVSWRSCF